MISFRFMHNTHLNINIIKYSVGKYQHMTQVLCLWLPFFPFSHRLGLVTSHSHHAIAVLVCASKIFGVVCFLWGCFDFVSVLVFDLLLTAWVSPKLPLILTLIAQWWIASLHTTPGLSVFLLFSPNKCCFHKIILIVNNFI